jgi:hypothetical protein
VYAAASGLGALGGASASGLAAVYGAPPDANSPRAIVGLEAPGATAEDGRSVQAMSAGMRACAQRASHDAGAEGGTARLELQIGADGRVLVAKEVGRGSLPVGEIACFLARAKRSVFDAGSARTLTIRVTHSTQK